MQYARPVKLTPLKLYRSFYFNGLLAPIGRAGD